MKAHLFTVQVYIEDTDVGGYVYHANYLKFAERARTEMIRAQGINLSLLQKDQSLFFVVRECKIDYLSPARLDDTLVIQTTVQKITGARIVIRQEMLRDHELLVSMNVTLALVDGRGCPQRIPAFMKQFL